MTTSLYLLRDEERRMKCIDDIRSLVLSPKLWSVKVLPYVKKRSRDQNDLYFAYIQTIADFTGYNKRAIHEMVAGGHLGYEMFTVFGRQIAVRKSTAELSTGEFTLLIQEAEKVALSLDLKLPLRDDYNYVMGRE